MAITNSALAQQISELVGYWRSRDVQFSNWANGAADGGPFADGRFPLSDYLGVVQYWKSPAALQSSVSGSSSAAATSATAASASAAAAALAQANAESARNLALSYRDAAIVARDLASSHKDNAANSEANALTYRNTAQSASTTATTAASGASTSATNAATSEANAASSASAAAASAAAAALFDSSNYYTKTAADARYRQLTVAITNSDITGLAWGKLSGVPATFTPSAHSHPDGDITGLSWGKLSGVPSTFTPSAHGHTASDVNAGTLSDARLSSNVALLDGTTVFNGKIQSTGWNGNYTTVLGMQIGISGGQGYLHCYDGTTGTYGYLHVVGTPVNITNGYLHGVGKSALTMTDTWLRLNQDGHFTSGMHTPYRINCGASIDANVDVQAGGGFRWQTDTSFYIYNTSGNTYGSWKIGGSRGAWVGLVLDVANLPTLMAHSNNSVGVYRQGIGAWSWLDNGSTFDVAQPIRRSSGAAYLAHASSSFQSGAIYVQNGGSPSGSAEGDITLIW